MQLGDLNGNAQDAFLEAQEYSAVGSYFSAHDLWMRLQLSFSLEFDRESPGPSNFPGGCSYGEALGVMRVTSVPRLVLLPPDP